MGRIAPAVVAAAGAAAAVLNWPVAVCAAGTFTVSSAADVGAGTLRQAIVDANAAGGGTIYCDSLGLVVLASPLPVIAVPLRINGNNLVITGDGKYRVFFVDAPAAATVTLAQMTVINGRAIGGNGANGGGGGLGAGGGVFVGRGNVVLDGVNLSGNGVGGGGGGGVGPGIGGGGGLGGRGGGDVFQYNGGGGGYAGAGAGGSGGGGGGGGGISGNGGLGDNNGSVGGGGGGGGTVNGTSAVAGGAGGAGGGGNGRYTTSNPLAGGGGGGGSPQSPGGNGNMLAGGAGGRFGGGGGGGGAGSPATGGLGGDYGGGGGASTRGGDGGFGGGGGAGETAAGNGGFGGGGGGNRYVNGNPPGAGAGGAFAGGGAAVDAAFSTAGYGGGGAALGGNVFVRAGAALTMIDTAAHEGILTGGASGGGGAASGGTAGTALFLAGPTTFSVSAGLTRTITGTIDDVGPFLAAPSAAGFALARITKTGPGTLVLQRANGYGGGNLISQGTLIAGVANALGPSTPTVTLNDANTASADTALLVGPGITFANFIEVSDLGTGMPAVGSASGSSGATIFSASLHLQRSVTLLAQNTTPLNSLNEPGQTRFDSPLNGAGGVTITGGNMIQYRPGGKMYMGRTVVTGNSTLSLYGGASLPNSIVQIDAGSTLVLDGATTGSIRGLAGAGTLRNNDAWGTSTLNVGSGTSAAVVNAFTGPILGGLALKKVGADTQEIGGQDNVNLGLTVALGRLRLLDDARVGNVTIQAGDAGAQSLDLAGHALRVAIGGLGALGLEAQMNAWAGTGAAGGDGVLDSTAASRPGTRVGVAFTLGSGQPLTVRLTLAGDADLDGAVDFNDLVKLAQNYNGAAFSALWDTGDFTYDGRVDFNDLVLLAQNYNGAFAADGVAAAGASSASGFDRDLAVAFAAVPEPTGWAWLAAATTGGLARRRERKTGVVEMPRH